jgi:hypothetical protein
MGSMAMFSIKDGKMIPTKTGRSAAVIILCLAPALSACAQSSLRLDPQFGSAVHQDVAAQIADPDAHYEGIVTPGSSGHRVNLAQKRYDTNQVIQPSAASASTSARSGFDNGSSGGFNAGASGASGGASQ